MARCRVTYLEVADVRPTRPGAADAVVDLADRRPERTADAATRPQRRACPAWLAQLLIVGLLAAGGLLAHVTGPDEGAPSPPGRGRAPAGSVEGARRHVAIASGPVLVPTRTVAAEPWRGVFEHHPADDPPDAVHRVHAVALAGGAGRAALLVVDATRRAFGAPTATGDAGLAEVRVLGEVAGAGLRTLQWDAGGYGVSLTASGLAHADHARLAGAVRLPDGPSLRSGEPPRLDVGVLSGLGLDVVGGAQGPATPWGSPLIGQSGGATVEGQLHQGGRRRVLVSVVADQAVRASTLRAALGPAVAVDPAGVVGITAAAAVQHPGSAPSEARVRGWSRLVLDHERGVTIELSSDALRVDELLDVARELALDRLARIASPSR